MDRIQPTYKQVVSDANTLTDTDSVGTLDDTCPLPLSVCVVNTVWDVLKGEILGQGGTDLSRVALQDFINYFETTWLCEGSRDWSIAGTDALKCSNDLESWHETMSLSIHSKDILWRTVPHLKDEQHAREKDMVKILQGSVCAPQRKFRKQKEEAINGAIAEYSLGSISEYEMVTRISYRLNH